VAVGYSVVGDALRAAATVARATGASAGGADLGGTVDGVGPALPGTTAADAAAALSDAWSDWVAQWQRDMTEHGDHMHDAAGTYDGAEDFGSGALSDAAGEVATDGHRGGDP